ncbi:unnamed protein product [Cunninghamella blakesleeana]
MGELAITSEYITYNDTQQQQFEITVRYSRQIEAFRALGKLLGIARNPWAFNPDNKDGTFAINILEKARFETQGVMIDCSRNGVLKVKRAKQLLSYMALMGLNMFQLYTEDTYEVEGEPLFGYMRGKYTRRDLCCIDDFAYDLGIEVIPCIQTLGHLGQVLQWPHYAHLRDNTEVLLAEFEPTYEFIERLISAATGPFRSKRIHLGMDESYGLGEGRYKQLFGYKEPTKIFVQHLQRMMEICSRYSLQPMIWSDMLFCLAAKNNSLQGYYDQENNPAKNSGDLVDGMPSTIDLVFWDYYHTNQEAYEQKLQHHRDLGCHQVWLANGAWSWSRFWTALPFTFQSIRASLLAAKNKAAPIRNTFITIWGDEGNECDTFSALPGLLYYAELGYCEEDHVDFLLLKQTFDGICGGSFDDWVYASKIDECSTGNIITSRTHFAPNISKWLLWEDPMLGFLTPQYMDEDLETHYGQIAEHLFSVIKKKKMNNNGNNNNNNNNNNSHHDDEDNNNNGDGDDDTTNQLLYYPLNARLELPARIAKILSLKCHLRQKCATAYKSKDYMGLFDLTLNRLLPLRKEVDELWKYHRKLWMTMYRPFGWEVLELRYGGLRTRLTTMYDRLIQYIEYKNSMLSNDHLSISLNKKCKKKKDDTNDGIHNEHSDDDDDDDDDDSNDDTNQYDIPELDVDLQYLYIGSRTNMLLDYSRVVSPSRPG